MSFFGKKSALFSELYLNTYKALKLFGVRLRYRLDIMSAEKTISYIKKNRCSIARYGDGEFELIFSKKNLGFQKSSEEISSALREVLLSDDERMLVCLPGTFNTFRGRNRQSMSFWRDWSLENDNQKRICKLLKEKCRKKTFGNSQITRPYIAMKSSKHAEKIFPMFCSLWENREVYVIEGEKTRLGVGNDLFDNAVSVKRILAPSTDAFSSRAEIVDTAFRLVPRDALILLALGPTATVIASDLCKLGYQALDIGHIDNEYEWFKAGVKMRTAIPGKYTNEAEGGHTVSDETVGQEYEGQIIARVSGNI